MCDKRETGSAPCLIEVVRFEVHKIISTITSHLRGSNIANRAARGTIALTVGTVIGKGFRFVRYMILARLLAPDDLGLMAIVITASRVFEGLSEVGVKQSVIQNKSGADYEYLNIAWWMQALRGIVLLIIATLLAPQISSFYNNPELLNLLRVSFLVMLFNGIVSPRAHVLEKEFKFGKKVLLFQGSSILGTIITIGLAFLIRNVWALVVGFVAEAAILCLLSHILVPFLPRFRINRKYAKELIKFARGMFGLAILTMIGTQADILVLGKLVTTAQLGMYLLADTLAYFLIELFAQTIYPVLLPAFSRKQDDRESLCRVVLQMTRAIATLTIPLIAFMASCASGILLLTYGAKYMVVAIPFGLLCLNILARTEAAVLGATYFAVGQPNLHRRYVALRAAISVSLIYPAILCFGLVGGAAVSVLSSFVALLMQIFWCRRIIDLKFSHYMRCHITGLLLALPIIGVVGFMYMLGINSPVLILIVGASLVTTILGIYVLKYLARLSETDKYSSSKLGCSSSATVNNV